MRQSLTRTHGWFTLGVFLIDRFLKSSLQEVVVQSRFFSSPGMEWMVGIAIFFLIVLFAIAVRWMFRERKSPWQEFLGWVVFGGVSNGIDVVAWGGVVDYIHVGTWWWNIADLMVLVGMVGLLWIWVKQKSYA